jgi:ectoine hydroxylase-related dioxygenase (phytanoyl-CoA dioxygenase family)
MLTCYIPLTIIDKNSNPMCIIKKSFKKKTLPHKKSKKLGFSSVIEENETLLDKKLIRQEEEILLIPGDVLFFHGRTIHYSKINKNNQKNSKRRMAVAIRILGENVKFSKNKVKKYLANIKYNRSFAIKKNLTTENQTSVKSI